MKEDTLLDMAREAIKNSYSPYSNFSVGASIQVEEDLVFTGTNIENASYSCCICAERTAAVKAVSMGYKKFKKISVVARDKEMVIPCGVCLQFLSEFMEEDAIVILEKEKKPYIIPFNKIYPYGFTLK